MEHTPGPWSMGELVHLHSHSIEPRVYQGLPLAYAHGKDAGETKANARLIAAAPDLLAACEAWIELGQGLDFRMYLAARPGATAAFMATDAAIAKAKGQR